MNKKNRQTAIKVLTGVGAAAVVGGAIATAIVLTRNDDSTQSPTPHHPITDTHLNNYTKNIVTKYAAMLSYFNERLNPGTDDINVAQQCGIFMKKVNDFQPNVSADSNSLKQDEINQRYAYVTQEAKKIGVDVADFDNYEKNTVPQSIQFLHDSLVKDSGMSDNDAAQHANQIETQMISKILPKAKRNFWSNEKMTFELNKQISIATAQWKNNKGSLEANESNANLGVALTHLESSLGRTLNVNNNLNLQQAFISNLKDYSTSGQLDINTEINAPLLANLFAYDYNVVEGVDFEDWVPDGDFTNPVDGEYDPNAKMTTTLPFATYDAGAATFGEGEFLPGYKAHVRIIDKENILDSHKCTLTLQFGVSHSTNPENVLWSQTENKAKDTIKDVLSGDNSGIMKAELTPNLEQIKYISQHTYYADTYKAVTLNEDAEDSQGWWFDSSSNGRTKIDNILNRAAVDPATREYLFDDDHQLFLTAEEDIAGITTTTDIKNNIPLGSLHSNQSLALRITDANYDETWLKLHWAVVDNIDGIYKEVKNIQWTWNDSSTGQQVANDIKVKFVADPTALFKISSAIEFIDLFSEVNSIGVLLDALTDDTIKLLHDKNVADDTLNVVGIAAGVACVALSITYTAMTFVPGAGAWAVAMLALSIASDVINAAFVVMQTMQLYTEIVAYEKFQKIWNEYKSRPDLWQEMITFGNSLVNLNLKLLEDPKAVIADRLDIAHNLFLLKNASPIFMNNNIKSGWDDFVWVLLDESVNSTTDINKIIEAIDADFDTAKDYESTQYVELISGAIGPIGTIGSTVIFDVFGSIQACILASKVFNEDWQNRELKINTLFDRTWQEADSSSEYKYLIDQGVSDVQAHLYVNEAKQFKYQQNVQANLAISRNTNERPAIFVEEKQSWSPFRLKPGSTTEVELCDDPKAEGVITWEEFSTNLRFNGQPINAYSISATDTIRPGSYVMVETPETIANRAKNSAKYLNALEDSLNENKASVLESVKNQTLKNAVEAYDASTASLIQVLLVIVGSLQAVDQIVQSIINNCMK